MLRRRSFGRNVIALSAVSFFTDASSEMIYPLLPVFLSVTLGASALTLGVIEGAAETTASLLKLASGWWSDKVRRRKPLIVFGYGLAAIVRPLMAVAQSAQHVLVIRLTDRVGKGVRGAPRDALLSESAGTDSLGKAFGLQRAADHAGAFVGPLIAFALLSWVGLGLRSVFWLALIPGMAALLTAVFLVRETPSTGDRGLVDRKVIDPSHRLPSGYRGYLAILFIFTLGNSTDAFLLLRAHELGVPVAFAPIIWALLHAIKSMLSVSGGALSDRIGRAPTLIAGWLVYGAVYVGFAYADASWHAWTLFAVYGVFYALTEPAERALVADLVPRELRGTAYGWFHLTVGIGMLPASILFGLVWDRYGSGAAFIMGAVLALIAAIALARLRPASPVTAGR